LDVYLLSIFPVHALTNSRQKALPSFPAVWNNRWPDDPRRARRRMQRLQT
jgi:hypothetical protein